MSTYIDSNDQVAKDVLFNIIEKHAAIGVEAHLALRKMKIVQKGAISSDTVFEEKSVTSKDVDTYITTEVTVETFSKVIELNNITSGYHFFEDPIAANTIGHTLRGSLKEAKIWPDEVIKVFVFSEVHKIYTGGSEIYTSKFHIYDGVML